MADAQTATDNNGQYAFTGLRAGSYGVEISGFDMDEVGFGSVSSSATVGVGESKIISFDGTYLRTAGIMGQVSVEGVGREGVTVTMTGEGEDETDVTDAGGLYGFSKLKAGDYSVAISGFDPDEVEFTTTSMNVSVALGETANVPFEGTLLRTSGISGRVSADGVGLDGVTVTLAGAAEDTRTTMNGGQYAFAGLAEGTYVVTISGWDEVAHNFDEKTSATIMLGDAVSHIENFDGTQTQTAGISGVLFIDEVMKDGMLTTGEPPLTAALAQVSLDPVMLAGLLAKAKVMLRGPDLNTVKYLDIDPLTSTFTSPGLVAGTYQVSLPVSDEMVAAALAAAGVAFDGESMVRTIAAGETGTANSTVNFPFEITMQTISVGAVMGRADEETIPDERSRVAGVTLALYATAQDAEDGDADAMLGEPMMTDEMGMATFDFARMADYGPGSEETDNLVFVKVATEEDAESDLVVSDNDVIEIEYPGVARVHSAPARVRLLNVAAAFDFWVKSTNEVPMERGGDAGLGGWNTEVFMGEDTVALMMENADGDTVNATMPTDTAMATRGKSTFSYRLTKEALAEGSVTFTVMVPEAGQPDMKQTWEPQADAGAITYEYDGFTLPEANTAEIQDQGPIRIKFTTQNLVVAVYREADDQPGLTNYQSQLEGGDQRPVDDVAEEMQVELMKRGDRNRLVRHEYKAFDPMGERTVAVANPMAFGEDGFATFPDLPANDEFIVRYLPGTHRVGVGGIDGTHVETFGVDLDDGMSTGAFGEDGGGGPAVRLCPLTTDQPPYAIMSDEDDDGCATFAYQWNSGKIAGKVSSGRGGVAGATVNLDPVTSGHSHSRTMKAGTTGAAKGTYSFSNVQDGVYIASTPATDDHKEGKSVSLTIYHNEKGTLTPDDGVIGDSDSETGNVSVTKLRLSIRGYVANTGSGARVARSHQTVAGAEIELWEFDEIVDGEAKVKAGGPVMTAEVDANGRYSFDEVAEGDYVVIAKNGDDLLYEMRRNGKFWTKTGKVNPDVYKDVDEQNTTLQLPSWDHPTGMVVSQDDAVTVGSGATAESFNFYNFALLHRDGEFYGRVVEARGAPEGVGVALERCASGTDNSCRPDLEYGAKNSVVGTGGSWSFPGLREAYYTVNVAAAGHNAAKWAGGKIDDDADNCLGTAVADAVTGGCDMNRPDDVTQSVIGKGGFNLSPVVFYVYNRRLMPLTTAVIGLNEPNTARTVIAINGTPSEGEAPADATQETLTDGVRAWADRAIRVTADVDDGARFEVSRVTDKVVGTTVTTDGDTTFIGRGNDEDTVQVNLSYNGTGTTPGTAPRQNDLLVRVVAENGYDDGYYKIRATVTNPIGNGLTGGAPGANDAGFSFPTTSNGGADPFAAGAWSTVGNRFGNANEVLTTVSSVTMEVLLKSSAAPNPVALQTLRITKPDGTPVAHTLKTATVATYEVTLPLPVKSPGVNEFHVTVTSEDGVAKMYIIEIQRAAS